MTQGIRPSQYITTFGPGAIVETPKGPFLLKSIDDVIRALHIQRSRPLHFAIEDLRLQRGLLNNNRVFTIPDEKILEDFAHPAYSFPEWNLCVQHDGQNYIHRRNRGCPECTGADKEESKNARYAIRFLIACPNGHLSDVNWKQAVHLGTAAGENCNSDYFIWKGTGASLSSIEIECPSCRAVTTLGDIYRNRLPCPGLSPERGTREACDERGIVVQRGSSQIRLPVVLTSLTIPPATRLHIVLQRQELQELIGFLKVEGLTETRFWAHLKRIKDERKIDAATAATIEGACWTEIEEAIQDLDGFSTPKELREYLCDEHRALERAARSGYPPYPPEQSRRRGQPPAFQINEVDIRGGVRAAAGHMSLRVVPIERLRTVLVQKGYKRVEFDNNPHETPTWGKEEGSDISWYPGVEHFGEGIYVDLEQLPGVSFYPTGTAAARWDELLQKQRRNGNNFDHILYWNALAVWWHTLSHRLINALSIHSGYSSTAIRERVYLSADDKGGIRGGVVLYTTQPGGDGTLGGLTSLVPHFEEVLRLALENLDNCSNDPLCESSELDAVHHLGAGCYSCLLVSETSCEHLNAFLDRQLLLQNPL